MKLWMVLAVWGSVQGTWGPLPYGMTECLRRAEESTSEYREKFKPLPLFNRVLTRDAMQWICLQSETRPSRCKGAGCPQSDLEAAE